MFTKSHLCLFPNLFVPAVLAIRMGIVIDRNVPPKDLHILIPRICEYITLHGNKDFANVIEVKDLEMGDLPGLSRWPNLGTWILESEKTCPAVVSQREMWCEWFREFLTVKTEQGGQEPRDLEGEKGKETTSQQATALLTPWCQPSQTCVRLWTCRL